jgi:crossover junction endodeoxyribonuclease RuvC
MTRTVGVDPGLTGALALLDGAHLVDIADMPVIAGTVDAYQLAALLAEWGRVDRVAVELQQAMPRQGVASTFRVAALERPVTHVTPAMWTRQLRVGANKGAHRRRAMDEWPAMADRFARVKDDGRADAALIALWAATIHNGTAGTAA